MSLNGKIEEIQHEINVMALQALKKLQDGDFDGFNKDWSEANRCRLNLQSYIESEAGITEMKYGQNINFGILLNVLLENFSKVIEDGDKAKIKSFKTIMNSIKKDQILREQFNVYNTFTNKSLWEERNPELTKEYIDEISSACKKIPLKEAKKHNLKLVKMFRDANLNENILINDDELSLYENIENLLFYKDNMNKVEKLTESKKEIEEYVRKHMISEKKDEKTDFDAKVSELTEKYESELNDDEKQLIETVQNCDDKEGLFNEYKSKTLNAINENISNYDGEDKNELKMIIEKLNEKKYNEKTIIMDIAEMIEIENIITEK